MGKPFGGKCETSSQPKVSNFENQVGLSSVNEKILRLQVSMQDLHGVAVMDSLEKLVA